MKRNQTFHERLIPMLVEGMGAQSYLELGTYRNDTISSVQCPNRIGVDINAIECEGVKMFRMTTAKFILSHARNHAPYDMVFIDADHNAKAVMTDFLGIWQFVSPDGLLLLHDTNPEAVEDTEPGLCGDAWVAARELHKQNYEAVTLPYHPGLTIVRRRGKWGPS